VIVNLPNAGLLTKQLPVELFQDLQQQVANESLVPMISGMTDTYVPKHYYLKDSTVLKNYVLSTVNEYISEFYTAIDYKVKSDGVDPDAKLHALEPWINYQKKNEWISAHDHSGIIAYSLWVNIPEDNVFEILYSTISGETIKHYLPVNKQSEGTIIFFPSKLIHTVHPFYNSEETRISISGNLILK
jgi:hypothetical protein